MAVLKYKQDGVWYDLTIGDGGIDMATADARYVNVDGDTMTGPLTAAALTVATNGEGIRAPAAGIGIFPTDGITVFTDNSWSGVGTPLYASSYLATVDVQPPDGSGLHWAPPVDQGVFAYGPNTIMVGGWSGAAAALQHELMVVGQPPEFWLAQDGVAYVGMKPTSSISHPGYEAVTFLNSSGVPEIGIFGYAVEIIDATSPHLYLLQLGVVGAGIRPERIATYDGVTILDNTLGAYGNITYNAAYPGSARSGKAAIIDLYNCMDKIQRLRPVEFTDKKITNGEHKYLRRPGLMADEVVNVLPGLVNKDEKGIPVGLNYEGLVPVLVGAIQEQQAQIETLEARISALEMV